MLYVMTLRPLWFAASSPRQRIATILHEAYHVSTRFDGSLHRGRRHARLPRAAYDRRIDSLLDRYLVRAGEDVLAPFARDGIVKVRMWLRRPGASDATRPGALEVGEHLFHGFMPLVSRPEPDPGRPRRPRRRPRGGDEEEGERPVTTAAAPSRASRQESSAISSSPRPARRPRAGSGRARPS
jgi:hypothetical protein